MEEAGFDAAVPHVWHVSSNGFLDPAKVGDQLGVGHPDGEEVGAPLLLRLGIEATHAVAYEGKDEGEDEGGEDKVDEDHGDRQHGLGGVGQISVGDVRLLQPSKQVRQKGL